MKKGLIISGMIVGLFIGALFSYYVGPLSGLLIIGFYVLLGVILSFFNFSILSYSLVFTPFFLPLGYAFIEFLNKYTYKVSTVWARTEGDMVFPPYTRIEKGIALLKGDFIPMPTIPGWIVCIFFSFIISFLIVWFFNKIRKNNVTTSSKHI